MDVHIRECTGKGIYPIERSTMPEQANVELASLFVQVAVTLLNVLITGFFIITNFMKTR